MFDRTARNCFLQRYTGMLICENRNPYGRGYTGYLIENRSYAGDWEESQLERICISREADTRARVFGICLEKKFEEQLKKFKNGDFYHGIEIHNFKKHKAQKHWSKDCVVGIGVYASFETVEMIFKELGIRIKCVFRNGKRIVYSFEEF